ncbi:hypothetical protein ACI0FN_01098 [Alcaligenes nematophilus]
MPPPPPIHPQPVKIVPGQVYYNLKYYFDKPNLTWKPKYELVIAESDCKTDLLSLCFTSQPHGRDPMQVCWIDGSQSGYYLGTLAGVLPKQTWADFTTVNYREQLDVKALLSSNSWRYTGITLGNSILEDLLRCLSRGLPEDLTNRQIRWIQNTIDRLQ